MFCGRGFAEGVGGFVHKKTQCISCSQLSPHPDWYLDLDGIELDLEVKEAVVIEK